MKHKYNIEHLLQSIIGYKGLPYPGAFSPNRPAGSYTGDNFDIPTSPAPQQELVKGTRLYKKDALGTSCPYSSGIMTYGARITPSSWRTP